VTQPLQRVCKQRVAKHHRTLCATGKHSNIDAATPLRLRAAKDHGNTCATATQSNCDAATPMQFASTRLQEPKELRWKDRSFSWLKPAPRLLASKPKKARFWSLLKKKFTRNMKDAKKIQEREKSAKTHCRTLTCTYIHLHFLHLSSICIFYILHLYTYIDTHIYIYTLVFTFLYTHIFTFLYIHLHVYNYLHM
jgi:hypothetical protein